MDEGHSIAGIIKNILAVPPEEAIVGGSSSIVIGAAPPAPRPPTTGGRRAPEPTRNRAPAFVEGGDASRSVAENSAGGTAVGEPISAKDRDNDKLAYQFRAAVDEFEVDKATGQISVADGANLDFEAKRSYSVTVRVADPDDRTDNISVTINITDVDEEGIIELPAEAPELGSELTVSLTDPDGTPMVVSWRWERSSDQVTWSAIDGAVSETYTASEADEGQYLRAIAMYTDVDGVEKESVKAFANPVPVAPAPTPMPTPTPVPATPAPTPMPTPTPVPATPAPTPMPTPTPVPATPAPTPVPTPTPVPATPAPTATPVPATPAPTATPVPATPAPTATPVPATPTATPVTAAVAPAPVPTPVPTTQPTVEPTVAPEVEEEGGFPLWALILIIVVAVLVVGGGAAYAVRSRTRT